VPFETLIFTFTAGVAQVTFIQDHLVTPSTVIHTSTPSDPELEQALQVSGKPTADLKVSKRESRGNVREAFVNDVGES